MVAQRRHISETESEVEEPGAKAMQMQLVHVMSAGLLVCLLVCHTPHHTLTPRTPALPTKGRDGEPLPRSAPWGAATTSRAALPLPRSRWPARSSPLGTGRLAGPSGSAWWLVPSTLATATQRWPAAGVRRKPLYNARTAHLPQPLPATSALARGAEVVGGRWAGVRSCRYKGIFKGSGW